MVLPIGFPEPDAAPEDGVDVILSNAGYAKRVDLSGGGFTVTRASTPYRFKSGAYDAEADRRWTDAAKAAIATEQPVRDQDSGWLDRRPPEPGEQHCLRRQEEGRKRCAEKQRINAIYADGLLREVQFPSALNDSRLNLWVRSSEDVLEVSFGHGLFASSHYRSVAPLVGGKVSEACAVLRSRVVNLFDYKYPDVEMTERIVHALTHQTDAVLPGPALRSWRLGAGDE